MTLLRKSDGPKYRSSHNLIGTGVGTLPCKSDGPKYIWDIRSFLVRTRNEPKKPPMGVPLGTPSAVRIFKMRTGSKWAKPNAFATLFGRKGCRLHLFAAILIGFRCLFALQMMFGENFWITKGFERKTSAPTRINLILSSPTNQNLKHKLGFIILFCGSEAGVGARLCGSHRHQQQAAKTV